MSATSARNRAIELAERINELGPMTITRFFSGAGLVANGVQFGFVMKGSLYLHADDKSRAAFEVLGGAPFAYVGKSKTVTVASYYEAPGRGDGRSRRVGSLGARGPPCGTGSLIGLTLLAPGAIGVQRAFTALRTETDNFIMPDAWDAGLALVGLSSGQSSR